MFQALDAGVEVSAGGHDREKEQEEMLTALRERLQGPAGRQAAEQLVSGGELSFEDDLFSELYLRRWLRARVWNLDEAEKSLLSHAEWRVNMMPEGRVQAAEVENELASKKVFLLGADKFGRGLLLIQAQHHNAWRRNLEELERFCCYSLDATIAACDLRLNPKGQIAVILDLTNLGTVSMDIPAVRKLFRLLGDHYVERLGQMVMYNPPLIFWGAWNTLSPLLPAATKKKILLVNSQDTAALVEVVGSAALPVEYGGIVVKYAPMC
ncbi:hypothetical protein CEUSTIGMA_g6041.t1 [Chlamydomonas eustigma]|uniref:CRAL-TRIO domain-containing protein n=1 Tax=Chlamydomonas eustigma TaxID=1157962 RepID=A0A250X6T9_9CHLO|nr:hypothetical protein CEUSTIGMA_g6041.t1 [Chlamydomonas eustigma]|eukprot:GAX78602.1 hypothetical protein CEUSTIGMA_g6041.t1 [Chlamydomonas eustigma]